VTTDYSGVVSFTIDTTPPAVTLSPPAAATNDNTPSLSGTAGAAPGDVGSVTVEIYSGTTASGTPLQTIPASVSGGSWAATAATLPDGTYTARAGQSDAAGNTGHSAKHTFIIDTVPPHTSITAGPPASTSATSASFGFSSSETGSTFGCRLDGAAWTACSSPKVYSTLSAGAHTFEVRAIDAAGNVDPAPPTRTWIVASSPPPTGTTPPTNVPAPSAVLQFTLRAKAAQHLGRRGRIVASLRCSTACTVALSGKVLIARKGRVARRTKSRSIALPRLVSTQVRAGSTVKLTIRLTARTRKAIRIALAKKRLVTLTLLGVAKAGGIHPVSAGASTRLLA
jgi:hypothetical protein